MHARTFVGPGDPANLPVLSRAVPRGKKARPLGRAGSGERSTESVYKRCAARNDDKLISRCTPVVRPRTGSESVCARWRTRTGERDVNSPVGSARLGPRIEKSWERRPPARCEPCRELASSNENKKGCQIAASGVGSYGLS